MTTMVRTAGMCNGTPDWQLDRAYETETAEALEKAYAEDDLPIIASYFDQADSMLNKAISLLNKAADLAEKHGFAHKIEEIAEKLEDFQFDMSVQADKLTRR